ncbi:MAG: amidohydrolase family protein [Gammaproteobacteria bacterium]
MICVIPERLNAHNPRSDVYTCEMLIRLTKFLSGTVIILSFILLAVFAVRWLLFNGVAEATVLPDKPVVDMHVHIAGLGYGNSGCFISDDLKKGYKFNYYLNAFGVTTEEMAVAGDQIVVQRVAEGIRDSVRVSAAIILAMDGVIDINGKLDKARTQVYIPNDFVAEQTAKYSELFFGASINPYRKDALERLEKVKRQGAKLIKWIPNIQHIDPADRKIIPFYQKMKALGLPLLSHAGQERSFGSANDAYGDPARLDLPLSLGVIVIAAHMATTGETDDEMNDQRLLPLLDTYPNLYSEISSLTQLNKLGYLDKALKQPKAKGRLLYGSDYPLTNMVLVSPWYFPLTLSLQQMWEISHINNPWDRDVALKQALGVPAEVFARSAELFGIQ